MSESVADILVWPQTKERLILDYENAMARGARGSCPIRDGIVDFLPNVADPISESYDRLVSHYDDYMVSQSFGWRLIRRVGWGFAAAAEYAQEVLAEIPDDFDGVLLDVPVGTGVLTVEKYRKLKMAMIIAVDYSLGMLKRAKQSFESNGIMNATYLRGDVGRLPVADSKVDMCLSMNGLHAFPDKDDALREIHRTLKEKSGFIGCFYMTGKRGLTDFLVRTVFRRGGTFAEPFDDERQALSRLGQFFTIVSSGNARSIFYFAGNNKAKGTNNAT